MDELLLGQRIDAAVDQIRTETARRNHPPVRLVRHRRSKRLAWRSGAVAVVIVGMLAGALQVWEPAGPAVEFAPADQPATSPFGWTTIAPSPTSNDVAVDAVWAQEELLVWAAEPPTQEAGPDGMFGSRLLAYSVADNEWQQLAEPPVVPAANRNDAVAVWADTGLIVYGQHADGSTRLARYDPAGDAWELLPGGPELDNVVATPVWTGQTLLVWGGVDHAGPDVAAVGAAYDTASGQWSVMSEAPIGPRQWHSTIWTGEEMIIWGGTDLVGADFGDGAAYNPRTDRWRLLAQAPIAGRLRHEAVWTGTEMIIVGGSSGPSTPATAAAYNPSTDAWRRLPDVPVDPRYDTDAVWTGTDVVFWGGYDYYEQGGTFADGAAYDPSRDRWTPLPQPPLVARCSPQLTASPHGVIIYGGVTDCEQARAQAAFDGAILTTSASPPVPASNEAALDAKAFTGTWYGPDGEVVSENDSGFKVSSSLGPDHCEWQSTVMLTVTWPPGGENDPDEFDDWRQYVRDPHGVLPKGDPEDDPQPRGPLDTDATVPAGSEDSGFHTDTVELWFGPDGGDEWAYLVAHDATERWPRVNLPIGCD